MSRFTSVFSQLFQLFSRVDFRRAVKTHHAERHARGFTCWGQLVAKLFCPLGRAKSLREIFRALATSELSPILMTALATGLALVPLVVAGHIPGDEIEHPLAVVILGGLVTSTLLNLFVVPALYLRFAARPGPDT